MREWGHKCRSSSPWSTPGCRWHSERVPVSLQVKSSDEAVILCKTAIGALKLNIGDLQVTKVRGSLGWGVLGGCDIPWLSQLPAQRGS